MSAYSSKKSLILIFIIYLFLFPLEKSYSQEKETFSIKYQMPPHEMIDLVDAPLTPGVKISPDGRWMLLTEYPYLTTIKELAKPELGLAGLLLNPENFGTSRETSYNKITIQEISCGSNTAI